MSLACRLPAAVAVLLGLGVAQPLDAQAFELTGAWSSSAELCKMVFTKKGNQVAFTELSDMYGSGFVINGDRIRGKSATCTIKSRKQQGDSLELSAVCATSIMTSSVRFNLKIIDDNSVSRDFPEVPGMSLKYYRCPS